MVNPGNGIFIGRIRLLGQIEIGIKRAEGRHCLGNIDAWHFHHADGGARHVAGQSHAADGGCKQFGIFIQRTASCNAIRADKIQPLDMAAEGTGQMMVFAMDIIGNGTADRDVLCAGRDREEPAPAARNAG